MTSHSITVIGANGRTGQTLSYALIKRNITFSALIRRPPPPHSPLHHNNVTLHYADLNHPHTLKRALANTQLIINTTHARHIPNLLRASPAPIIALGSTRKFTQWPDDHARGVILGENALLRDKRPSLILHPTMIYGAHGENNVQRLLSLLKYLPIIPLPEKGQSLVQPIYQDDVIHCILSAIELIQTHRVSTPHSLTIAGPKAFPYSIFIKKILYYSGQKQRPIISIPSAILSNIARITAYCPKIPTITPDEVRRLLENKNTDITSMRHILKVEPCNFDSGLKCLFKSEE